MQEWGANKAPTRAKEWQERVVNRSSWMNAKGWAMFFYMARRQEVAWLARTGRQKDAERTEDVRKSGVACCHPLDVMHPALSDGARSFRLSSTDPLKLDSIRQSGLLSQRRLLDFLGDNIYFLPLVLSSLIADCNETIFACRFPCLGAATEMPPLSVIRHSRWLLVAATPTPITPAKRFH